MTPLFPETPLPNMTTRVVVLMIPPHVRGEQPHHVIAQIAILGCPDGQVKMVAHQAKRQQPHVAALTRLLKKPKEGKVILILVKDGTLAVASIEDVIAVTSLGCACGAWHETIVAGVGTRSKRIIVRCPLIWPLRQRNSPA